jgi:hypothetical protein
MKPAIIVDTAARLDPGWLTSEASEDQTLDSYFRVCRRFDRCPIPVLLPPSP